MMTNANYFSGANDTIKIALIGCGGRGTGAALQALQSKQNVKLVAMADAFRDRLDNCFKNITADDLSDNGTKGSVKNLVDVPEALMHIKRPFHLLMWSSLQLLPDSDPSILRKL